FWRETRELVTLDACELIWSPFALVSDYAVGVALDYMAEVTEQLLPPAEPNEKFFRLLLAMLDHLRATGAAGVWQAVAYFTLWAVKLAGWLPPLRVEPGSQELAEEILHTPISRMTPRSWSRETAADLRRFLIRQIEEHIERKLVTAPLLETA
ncbi:MAG: DNA repair protein RecO, partial [Bryobacteraceae bacterium]